MRWTLDDAAVDPVLVLTELVIVRKVAGSWGPVVPPPSTSGHRRWHRELAGMPAQVKLMVGALLLGGFLPGNSYPTVDPATRGRASSAAFSLGPPKSWV